MAMSAIPIILFLRAYQILISPLLSLVGIRCIHHPSCSHYAILALRKYPLSTAIAMTKDRLRECHPFSGRPYIDFP